MSRTKALKNVKLTSFDDLFGGKVVEETAETGDVKEIPLSELHEFHNHPFQIRSDEEMEEMIESVREHGVLVPGIVRKREQGGYKIIAGHTRKHVCEVLGLDMDPLGHTVATDAESKGSKYGKKHGSPIADQSLFFMRNSAVNDTTTQQSKCHAEKSINTVD